MAEYEKRDNSGALFINKRKEKETHPDRTGHCTVAGVDYWISGWLKTPNAGGDQFCGLSFTPKEDRPDNSRRTMEKAAAEVF